MSSRLVMTEEGCIFALRAHAYEDQDQRGGQGDQGQDDEDRGEQNPNEALMTWWMMGFGGLLMLFFLERFEGRGFTRGFGEV